MTRSVRAALCTLALWLAPAPAAAQHTHETTVPADRWVWKGLGQIFLNLNVQDRKFTDFTQFESQNWGMVRGIRQSGRARLSAHLMVSAEPWTLRRLGSAQVLQSGETLDAGPLLDYQHPHDLIMAIEARLDWQAGERTSLFVAGGPVGAPALGPPPFMHRPSAGHAPTSPLSHHMQDSSHITHGVVTAGMVRGEWTAEASVFRGREPDEDRVGLDMGALDSVAGRVAWQRGPWRAQVSSAHLNEPEAAEPGDAVRLTASLQYDRMRSGGRSTAWLAAWGRNGRDSHAESGWLLEGRHDITPRDALYGRAELADRFILVDFDHAMRTGRERHLPSWVAAVTLGYQRAVIAGTHMAIALGADVTIHRVSPNLRDSYGAPVSWHVFLRLHLR